MIETKQQVFDDLCEDMETSDQAYWRDRYANAAINSEPITAMTTKQKIFYQYLVPVFEDHNQDIIGTICWCMRHVNSMPYDVHLAYSTLSPIERTQVINELCLPF